MKRRLCSSEGRIVLCSFVVVGWRQRRGSCTQPKQARSCWLAEVVGHAADGTEFFSLQVPGSLPDRNLAVPESRTQRQKAAPSHGSSIAFLRFQSRQNDRVCSPVQLVLRLTSAMRWLRLFLVAGLVGLCLADADPSTGARQTLPDSSREPAVPSSTPSQSVFPLATEEALVISPAELTDDPVVFALETRW